MTPSLRRLLLRWLAAPLLAMFAFGGIVAFFLTIRPAALAYDQSLTHVARALALHVAVDGGQVRFALDAQAQRVLRSGGDGFHFAIDGPHGEFIAGERDLPLPPHEPETGRPLHYDARYHEQPVRMVALAVAHGAGAIVVRVAQTSTRLARTEWEVYIGVLIPAILLAIAIVILVWNGIGRGLRPLLALRDDIAARSARDLRPVDLSAVPQEVRPFVLAINDLLQRLGQATDAQQRFLANAAHQLRTPLAGLQAQVDVARKLPASAELHQALDRIRDAAARTARLANQLLTLARSEPGGFRGDTLRRTDLHAIVDEAATQWVHRARALDIDLGFELGSAPVLAEPFLVRELLANLIDNALQYTPRGGKVTVRCGSEEGRAYLEVEDNGPGIPPQERDKVLQRFYRLPGSPGSGSGLGLAIVNEIAQAHGAGLTIAAPACGQGTLVTVRFPAPGEAAAAA